MTPADPGAGREPREGAGPVIHAVIVHHRGADLLARAVESVLDSAGVDLQVVVVANACDEPIPQEVLEHPAVHLVESERPLGFSRANNLGVERARASLGSPAWYYFLNNDTISTPLALARMVEVGGSDAGPGVVGPRLMIAGAEDILNSLGLRVTTSGEAWDEGIGRPLEEYEPLSGPREALALTGSALLVRRDVFEAVGGWNELYGYYYEDIDLCLRARSLGYGVINVPSAVVLHAISATSDRISDFKRLHSWRNRFLLIVVHWPGRLLLASGPRLIATELAVFARRLRVRATSDARLQLRSWLGALRLLPKAVRSRRSRGRATGWARLLSPPGSVPEIVLPSARPRANPAPGHAKVRG